MIAIDKLRFKEKSIFILLFFVLLLTACNSESVSNKEVPEELLTEEEGLYNLYFIGNDSAESEVIEKDLNDRWIHEEYRMVVYNARFYNFSNPDYVPDKELVDYLELNEGNTPILILFDHKGIALETDDFDEILEYINEVGGKTPPYRTRTSE